MVAYSFQKRFEAPIRAGIKRHTIRDERAGRSRHGRPGERVQLYVGMRTKHCRLVATPVCDRVWPIRIVLDGIVFANDGWIRSAVDLDAFAVSDGFADWADMRDFWAKHHPGIQTFSGVLIGWAPIKPEDLRPQAAEGSRWASTEAAALRPVS